jgi:wobble nucleotide-excising tRNase
METILLALENCEKQIYNARMNLVTTALESHKPLIQNLYKRFQPHPVFTEIDFEVVKAYKEAELYFRVFRTGDDSPAYPSTIFSASQLNALAVCLFLAMSLRASGPLQITLLDDPIQSMDDINVLGFCDVIRQVKARKQLFISTHDDGLFRLLLNKLRPTHREDETLGFSFKAWTTEGPVVDEQSSEFFEPRVDLHSVGVSSM